jgi:hypothetical protein
MLGVGLDGSRRIQPAHLACPVGPDRSRPIPTDRLDDQRMIKAHPTQHRMPRKQDPSGKAVAQPRAAARPSPGLRSPARALTFRATAPPSDEATERAGAGRDRSDEGAARASRRPRLGVAAGAGHGPLLGETTSSASGLPARLAAGRVRGPEDHGAVGAMVLSGPVQDQAALAGRLDRSSRWAWSGWDPPATGSSR